tara:strand:+ start:325 stop:780 length:456 start_codon:yes stop_codon:yes gene_type:complete
MFGFIKQAAQKAGKKMYGFGEKHPVATAAGILGGAYVAGEASGFNESIGRHRIGEWLESKPELMEALQNEVGVMKIMEKGVDAIKSKFPNAHRMEMNPHRSNIRTITSYIEKDPKKMQYLLESFKPEFRGHLMSSIENHVNIIHKQAMERR